MADRFTFSLVASSADATGRMAFPANSLSAARPEDLSGDGRGASLTVSGQSEA